MDRGGWIYILKNHRNGTLYTGVTANLPRRYEEHRSGLGSQFARKYGLTRLVYWERVDEIETAIRREKAIKRWPRAWKINLIEGLNPDWIDLSERLNW